MSCLTEMMPLPTVSPNGDRVVDHFLLGVASSSDRSWLHRVRGVAMPVGNTIEHDTSARATTTRTTLCYELILWAGLRKLTPGEDS